MAILSTIRVALGLTLISSVLAVPTTLNVRQAENLRRPLPQAGANLGCYAEPPRHDGRALKGPSIATDDMTTEKCASYCSDYKYFGTEWGRECFCDNKIFPSAQPAEGKCNKPCAGDSSTICGDGDHLNMYLTAGYVEPIVAIVGGYSYKGCHTEPHVGRALPDKKYTQDDLTPQMCGDLCSADGYLYAGLEWGKECWCANTIKGGKWVDDSECTKLCSGDKYSFCGESQRLTIYGPDELTIASVDEWDYVGCAVDSQSSRVLNGKKTTGEDMTAEKCASICSDFEYFGVELGSECYCGRSFDATTSLVVPDEECALPCAGDGTTFCGDADRINIYTATTHATNLDNVGAYRYAHCSTDSVQDRALKGSYSGAAGMTIEKCAAFCSDYTFFGIEFGKECFCGNEYTGLDQPHEECHMRCEGDKTQICGGKDRISVYDSTPLVPIVTVLTPICRQQGACHGGSTASKLSDGQGYSACRDTAADAGVFNAWFFDTTYGECWGVYQKLTECAFGFDVESNPNLLWSDLSCPVKRQDRGD